MTSDSAVTTSVSTAELCRTLETLFRARYVASAQVHALRRQTSSYCTSSSIEELEVTLADGATLDLVLKNVGANGLLAEACNVKPAFLFDPLREITVYRDVLAPEPMGTAHCFGVVIDARLQRYWLFLEKVHGRELYQSGDLNDWQDAARWLARFHGRHVRSVGRETEDRLIRYDRRYYRQWMERAEAFIAQGTPAAAQQLAPLASRYGDIVEQLADMPATVLHGDYHASNVLIRDAAVSPRVCPVDWERAAIGPGLVDLASLVAGSWTDCQRVTIARAYYDTWGDDPPWPQFEEMWTALKYCRIHEAVQWLGWAPQWQPPPEHCFDWLDDALQLAETLPR